MTTNISNPSSSHYAEPQWQALLKTAILPEGFPALVNMMQKQKLSQVNSQKKSQKLILGLPLSELHPTAKLLASSTCEKGALPSPDAQ